MFSFNVVLKKKRGKEKADEAKKRRILRIELNWMMMMESQRRTLRVFSLSLFLAIDDDEIVVVMPIAFFFRVLRLLVLTKEKPSSRVRAIIIRILP